MSTLLIKNISTLVTNDDQLGDFKDGAIYIEDNEIKQVGYTKDLPQSADQVIDASDHLVCPGFVNTHHHFYQTLTAVFLIVVFALLIIICVTIWLIKGKKKFQNMY